MFAGMLREKFHSISFLGGRYGAELRESAILEMQTKITEIEEYAKSLKETLAKKDEYIHSLLPVVEEKDKYIASLLSALKEKDEFLRRKGILGRLRK